MSKNASAASIWSDHAPPDRVDPDAFLFMGADPCWSPAREIKLPDDADAAGGLCAECGGDDDADVIPDGSHRVCARCGRYGRDRRPHSLPALATPARIVDCRPDPDLPVACPDQPGYVTRNGVTVPERFARLLKG
jgi:hypothetical protein